MVETSSLHSSLVDALDDLAMVVEVCTLSTDLYLYSVVFEPCNKWAQGGLIPPCRGVQRGWLKLLLIEVIDRADWSIIID